MPFQIVALDPTPFAPLFAMSDAELAACDTRRVVATANPGSPCRVSLVDAEVGETMLLINHEHLPVASPFRSRHAVFVREHAVRAEPPPGEVPPMIARRLISARAFDNEGMMIQADVLEGHDLAPLLDDWFDDAAVAHIDLHAARQGCFAARAVRA